MLFIGQRKNRSSLKTAPVPILCIKRRLSRDNTPIIAFTYCINKFFGGSLGTHGYRTDQPGLIVDREGTGGIDEILACLERMVVPLNSYTTFATQGVLIIEYKDDLDNGVKIGVCHTIGDHQTTENSVGVPRPVDMDVASKGTTGHSD